MGSQGFVENVQTSFGTKANRKVTGMVGKHALGEQAARYEIVLEAENISLRLDNRLLRDD